MDIMRNRFLWLLFFLLTSCTVGVEPEGANTPVPTSTAVPAADVADISNSEPAGLAGPRNRRVVMEDNYSFALSLGFDSIQPVYSPEFAAASEAPLNDEELVLGVAWEGEAKAYPISVLRYREMVDDELAGIPTLVTW